MLNYQRLGGLWEIGNMKISQTCQTHWKAKNCLSNCYVFVPACTKCEGCTEVSSTFETCRYDIPWSNWEKNRHLGPLCHGPRCHPKGLKGLEDRFFRWSKCNLSITEEYSAIVAILCNIMFYIFLHMFNIYLPLKLTYKTTIMGANTLNFKDQETVALLIFMQVRCARTSQHDLTSLSGSLSTLVWVKIRYCNISWSILSILIPMSIQESTLKIDQLI